MSGKASYEVQSFKDGGWKIETVLGDKEDALDQARTVLEGRFAKAVKVIEEIVDEDTGDIRAKIIFKEEKGVKKKPRHKKIVKKEDKDAKAPAVRKKKKKSSSKALIKLVVILGGILLGMVALVFVYIETFSKQ
ncbi:MAG: hypothetical protein V3R66_06680 [Rhodospirillales bacterium]